MASRFGGWGHNNTHWPAHVLSTLEAKYHLSPQYLRRLWYVTRQISRSKPGTDYIYIFDWVKAREQGRMVRDYNDLTDNSDLILFKGSLYRDGSVSLRE
jgi:hypothetical protein